MLNACDPFVWSYLVKYCLRFSIILVVEDLRYYSLVQVSFVEDFFDSHSFIDVDQFEKILLGSLERKQKCSM